MHGKTVLSVVSVQKEIFEVDVIWENHQLKEAVVRSNAGGDCVIKYADQTISFKTVKGRSYQIGYDAAKGLIKK